MKRFLSIMLILSMAVLMVSCGKKEVKDGVLTLKATVDSDDVFNFSVEDGKLVFIAEGSDGFRGGDVTVEDGDKFLLKEE